MQYVSWSNMGLLILSSFLLINLIRSQNISLFEQNSYGIKTWLPILCGLFTVCIFGLIPQAFPLLIVLAVAGATEIISLITNKCKIDNANVVGKTEESFSLDAVNTVKVLTSKNGSDNVGNYSSQSDSFNNANLHFKKFTDCRGLRSKLIKCEEREKSHLQEVTCLNLNTIHPCQPYHKSDPGIIAPTSDEVNAPISHSQQEPPPISPFLQSFLIQPK